MHQLHQSISEGSLENVKELVDKKGVSPLCRFKELCLPIHIAAKQGSLPIIKFLINKGADPNEIDVSGRYLLLCVCSLPETHCIGLLNLGKLKWLNSC